MRYTEIITEDDATDTLVQYPTAVTPDATALNVFDEDLSDDDLFAKDTQRSKIGNEFIEIGREWARSDPDPESLTRQYGPDIVMVGRTILRHGVEAGIKSWLRSNEYIREFTEADWRQFGIDPYDYEDEFYQ